jgi:hypothetical protein
VRGGGAAAVISERNGRLDDVTDIIPIANYRTRLEAELAGRLLEGAAVPYVINSAEGMFHGPLADGATILVRADDVELARDVLEDRAADTAPRVVRIATCPTSEAADRVREALAAAGIPALSSGVASGEAPSEAHLVWVPAAQAARARRAIGTAMLEP